MAMSALPVAGEEVPVLQDTVEHVPYNVRLRRALHRAGSLEPRTYMALAALAAVVIASR